MKDRDVDAFDRRAAGYESGAVAKWHQRVIEQVADIPLAASPDARQVLDVGCGTGAMLRLLAARLPHAVRFIGVDPAPAMIETAASRDGLDTRVQFKMAAVEALPFDADNFDLVVSTTSFDHWGDQRAGLVECGRVLSSGSPLVLCDLFSPILRPTMWLGRRGRARTVRSGSAALESAGFTPLAWHPPILVKTVVAR